MDGDGPQIMARTQRPPAPDTAPGTSFGGWPLGPWDLTAPPPHAPSAPWPSAPLAPALVNVYEDLYPDSSAPSVALQDPFSAEVDMKPDMLLPALSAFPTYQQYTIQDSLLPDDSYAALPPEYPLYNWTLPYGPERDWRSMTAMTAMTAPAPSPSPNQRPCPPCRQPAVCAPSGIRVQFKGPSEIRRSCTQPEQNQPQHQQQRGAGSAGYMSAMCPNLLPVDLDDAVVEVEVRTCRQDESSSASERVTFDSIEDALASIEAQEQLAPPQVLQLQEGVALGDAGDAGDAGAATGSRDAPFSGGRKLPLADEKQDEVVKAAKSLFSKRTRTLYHWLYPDTSKTKLKATVSAAWDTLADTEKQFYLSQVLGRFGLQASSVMINPQLDGLKGLPIPELGPSWTGSAMVATTSNPRPPMHALATSRDVIHGGGLGGCHFGSSPLSGGQLGGGRALDRTVGLARASSPRMSEAQEAVNQLFASCADSETWASYSCSSADTAPTPAAPRPALKTRTLCGHAERRKRPSSSGMSSGMIPCDFGPRVRLSAVGADHVDEEVTILKEMRDARLEAELAEDAELSSELEKFRLLASGERAERPAAAVAASSSTASYREGDDYWRGTPDPEDIFTQLHF